VIRYLSVDELLLIHGQGIDRHGGGHGVLSLDAVKSAAQQPQMSFGGQELYPTIPLKAAALGFSLIKNHAFVDGNKRVGFSAMVAFLLVNDLHLRCSADEGERMVLEVISGQMSRDQLATWIEAHSSAIP
jgi:death-on-curing protein